MPRVWEKLSHTNMCREYTAVKISAWTFRRRPVTGGDPNTRRHRQTSTFVGSELEWLLERFDQRWNNLGRIAFSPRQKPNRDRLLSILRRLQIVDQLVGRFLLAAAVTRQQT